MDEFSHRFLGSIGFCLPMGLVLLALFYALRLPLVRMLPSSYQQALLPVCERPRGPLWGMVISLLIGAWTHLLWDSFTHADGGIVRLLPLLQSTVISVGGRTARVCHLLWYGCSFGGVVWLCLVFERWKRANVRGCAGASGTAALRDAVLVAILAVPVELMHHRILPIKLGLYLVAALCALPVIGVLSRMAGARRDAPATKG